MIKKPYYRTRRTSNMDLWYLDRGCWFNRFRDQRMSSFEAWSLSRARQQFKRWYDARKSLNT